MDTLPAAVSEHVVDDRHDIGQRLAGARARRKHVALAFTCGLDSLTLVFVQHQTRRTCIGLILLWPEDLFCSGVQDTCGHELFDRSALLERRVQREPRVGPLGTVGAGFVQVVENAPIVNVDESLCECAIVLDEVTVNLKCVHVALPR